MFEMKITNDAKSMHEYDADESHHLCMIQLLSVL
jgi:hypothetical protein